MMRSSLGRMVSLGLSACATAFLTDCTCTATSKPPGDGGNADGEVAVDGGGVVCGAVTCAVGEECCVDCSGNRSCLQACPGIVCLPDGGPDAGSGRDGGASQDSGLEDAGGQVDAGSPDAGGHPDGGTFDAGFSCTVLGGNCASGLDCFCCPGGGASSNCICSTPCGSNGDCRAAGDVCKIDPLRTDGGFCAPTGFVCCWLCG